jgi:hypothetical protein
MSSYCTWGGRRPFPAQCSQRRRGRTVAARSAARITSHYGCCQPSSQVPLARSPEATGRWIVRLEQLFLRAMPCCGQAPPIDPLASRWLTVVAPPLGHTLGIRSRCPPRRRYAYSRTVLCMLQRLLRNRECQRFPKVTLGPYAPDIAPGFPPVWHLKSQFSQCL